MNSSISVRRSVAHSQRLMEEHSRLKFRILGVKVQARIRVALSTTFITTTFGTTTNRSRIQNSTGIVIASVKFSTYSDGLRR
jgi:hypothetical protein